MRSRLVREGISFLGMRFWTPSDVRTFLLGEISPGVRLATRPELRLLARMSAEKLARNSAEPTLSSVERDPELFLRAFDLLLAAGWEPSKSGPAYGRELAREMERTLKERKILTQAGLHRLLKRHDFSEPLMANLLLIGFNAAHWPLWDLLRATVAASKKTTLALLAPRVFAGEIDQLWIGSWEEEAGEPAEFAQSDKAAEMEPFADWTGAYERGASIDARDCDFAFLANPDLEGQVEAVVLKALDYLGRDSCRRLGIVFPEENALALGVAEKLRQLGVPLDDGTGYLEPGLFERRAWPAWLKLQEEPGVERLIEWVRACEAEGLSYGTDLPARELADLVDRALGETLIDELSFLSRYLEENSKHGSTRKTAELLRTRIQLPESGTFSEFWTLTQKAMQELGWIDYLGPIEPPEWLRSANWSFSRRTYIEWLRESADSRQRTRGPGGNHFYGKVHLLIYAQMSGQTWTHLILTGLNEGYWPRVFESGAFGSRHELTELNRQARALNRSGTRQGAQGAGHEAVQADHGYCILPLERHDLALRDLCAAVESTSHSVCFAAMTTEAGRGLLPSDLFAHAYQSKTGRTLDEATFSLLAKATGEWCRKQTELLRAPIDKKSQRPDVSATQIAYQARRDPVQPFGPYEFAFATLPAEPIQLSCKEWEDAWHHPASVWLKKIIGVSAWPEGQLGWSRAVGTWVHRWLNSALNIGRERGDVNDLPALLRAAADREAQRIGAPLYPWWKHVWGEARAIALGLGEELVPHLRERLFLSEYKIPKDRSIALPGTDRADFELRGKIDLLLIEPNAAFDPASGNFSSCSCWVIDFKTGSAKNLTPSKLEKGIGLQPMLYALAIRAAGAESIAVSLQTFDTSLKPQVQIEQVEAGVQLFRSLDRLHRAGIFGMRPDLESDYGFAPSYPMATRPVDSGVLETKWALVHGTAALEEES